MIRTGPVTVACPVCRVAFPVPCEVLAIDGALVIVRMDRSALFGHLQECGGRPAAPELPRFVVPGRRTCIMCGTPNAECLASLRNGAPCCGACGEGDTHPAPGDH